MEGCIRAEKLQREDENSPYLEMPDVGNAAYIIQLLFDVGISVQSGMGLAPINWTELRSWTQVTRVNLSPWEAETIILLSRHFVMKHSEFDKKNVMSEYQVELTTLDRAKVSDKVGSFFRSLMARRKKDG